MPEVVTHFVQQSEARVVDCMGLDHNHCPLFRVASFLYRMENTIPLFDEISYHLWAETEGCKFLDNLVNQFLELWRVESGNREGRQGLWACLAVVDCILPELGRQGEEDLRIRFGEMHHCADCSWGLIKAREEVCEGLYNQLVSVGNPDVSHHLLVLPQPDFLQARRPWSTLL